MRQCEVINLDWLFHRGECEGADYKGFPDQDWEKITLPHDWSVRAPFDPACSSGTGYLAGGVGWYRKHFTLPESLQGKRVFLTFGGIYQNGQVWVNSYYFGKRPYGYSSYTYEVTDRVIPGENVLCVRAEHLHLADSRWFTGAGIYRDVTLTITEEACIAPNGVFARTVSADASQAQLVVDVEASHADQVRVQLLSQDNAEVACAEGQVTDNQASVTLCAEHPHLWSPEHPALYTLRCSALCNGQVTDSVSVPFGIRTAVFDANQGLLLNGERCLLKGVCVHHDAGALGAAVPVAVWRRRLLTLKQCGCNAIRFSHNPHDPHLLDLCDEMGFVAIGEAFDEWEGCKNKWWQGHNVYPPKHYGYSEEFPAWHERDLTDMIRRDRNHPCIIMWSIGNELEYPNDPYVHELFPVMMGNNDCNKPEQERYYDPNKPNARRLTAIAKELVAIAKRADSSRPISAALAFPELSTQTGLADTLDIVGYNYKEHLYEADHAKWPNRVLFGSENSTSADAWLAIVDKPYIGGQFLWTGVDYLGEAKGWPIHGSGAGLIDMAGHPKALWHQRRALWTNELCAALFILDEKGSAVEAWTGVPEKPAHVCCMTNADKVTLLLDGKTVAEKAGNPACCVEFDLPFAAGRLTAHCAKGAHATEVSLVSAGAAAALKLTSDQTKLPADGQSIAQIEVTLVDSKGRLVCTDDADVTYTLSGSAAILGIENGDLADVTSYAEKHRSTLHGRAIVYVRAGTQPSEVTLTASRREDICGEIALVVS